METVLSTVLSSIKMIGAFMIPFVLIRVADISFGIILSFKDDTTPEFDPKKVLNGILLTIGVGLGIMMLACGVAMLPTLLEIFNITILDTTALNELVSIASILGVLVTSIVTYGKDAYDKLLKIAKIEKTSKIINIDRIDEEGNKDVRYS